MNTNTINPTGYNSPLGKASHFYRYFDNPDPLPQEENFNYKIVICNSGVEVFDYYNQNKEHPTPKQIIIYIEKPENSSSNFFGTACRVCMGEERMTLMKQLLKTGSNVVVKDANMLAISLSSWARDIAYVNKKVDANALTNAVRLELMSETVLNDTMRDIFSLNKTLADWIGKGIDAIEKYKFTEKNYDYDNQFLKPNYNYLNGFSPMKPEFDPLLPIPTFNFNGGVDRNSLSTNKAIKQLGSLYHYFDELSLGVVAGAVASTPTLADDAFLAVIYMLKNIFEGKLDGLGSIKALFLKLKELVGLAYENCKKLASKIAHLTSEAIALLNSFLCGIINGLISVVQVLLSLIAFAVEHVPALDLKQLSPDKLTIIQEKLEFVEDFVELISKNAKPFFEGILTTLLDAKTYTEIITFVKSLWEKGFKKISNYNKYEWAYIVGAIGFEILLDVIIAYFTGGTSLVAEAMSKISRLSTKFEKLAAEGVKAGKAIGNQVAKNAKSLFEFLKKEFEEFVEALRSGTILNWLKKKFYELTDDVAGLRKLAYDDFVKAVTKENLKELTEHIFDGHLRTTKVKGKGKIPSAKGVHSEAHFGKFWSARVKPGTRKPPKVNFDEIYEAEIQVLNANRYWVDKIGFDGSVIKSTMFPVNWKKERIMEEIAFAWKNLKPTSNPNKFKGFSTNGIEIEFIIRNNEITTVYPKF